MICNLLYIFISDYLYNKKIRKCTKELKSLKGHMFENENAFGAISDKEHIAIVQIDSQLQELKLCLQCPFLSKCKKGVRGKFDV